MPTSQSDEVSTKLPNRHKAFGILLIGLCVLVLIGTAFLTYEALTEAYGSGPPYFSRTENMDKWSNPFWELFAINTILLCIAFLFARAGFRRLHQQA